MDAKLDLMIELLHQVNSKLDKQAESNDRLDKHISFIERVYQSLHNPLTYFKNKFNYLMGKSEKELEHII